uniref:Uncharacterized protein n=1 Tax=Pan paniscus TaxID=9597 RepID=A0A2R8ZEP7_PANPA
MSSEETSCNHGWDCPYQEPSAVSAMRGEPHPQETWSWPSSTTFCPPLSLPAEALARQPRCTRSTFTTLSSPKEPRLSDCHQRRIIRSGQGCPRHTGTRSGENIRGRCKWSPMPGHL